MPYLVDGHNLIPKLGLRLDSVDDELELIAILQEFSRTSRKAIEVYFDGAPAGSAGTKRFGQVQAHFVSHVSTADDAIKRRLTRLGRAAKDWTVVSSDREVVHAAANAHARSESSEEFARKLRQGNEPPRREGSKGSSRSDGGLSDQEVRRWLELFKKR